MFGHSATRRSSKHAPDGLNVVLFVPPRGDLSRDAQKRISCQGLESVGLISADDSYDHSSSLMTSGQRQLLAMAGALLKTPVEILSD